MSSKALEPKVPTDLRKVLAGVPKAAALWKDLTPIARRDFITWIESAKQPETRKRRVDSLPSRLLSGKRRPCCFMIIPMSLYKALGKDPKAKDMWKDLTPMQRRDFVSWIDEARDKEEHALRIMKALIMLSKGKKHP